MDLGTILKKLKRNQYGGDVEKFHHVQFFEYYFFYDFFLQDLSLVWSNCMTYNLEYSELYMIAEE
jgi:hypothetical protein